jgi:hypothetical protein
MAVVGEAHIIVRAITTSVKDDIKKGFNGVDDTIKQTGERARKVFSDDFAKSTAGARAAFSKLVRTGYILQGAIGTLAGTVGSLIGGLGALIGAAGGAAGSVGAFAGVIAALPAGLATFKLALGGVGQAVSQAVQANKNYADSVEKARNELRELQFDAEAAALGVRRAGLSLEQARENLLAAQQLPPNSRARREAELAYEEADLAYRRAQEQAEEAEKAKKRAAKAGGGGTDPFANLNASQEKFARYLVTLQPLIKDLKAAASGALLPILQDQIDRLVNGTKGTATFFEVIRDGIKRTSTGLGSGITKFVDALTNPKNLANLKAVFDGIQPVFETFGKVFGSLFGSFLTITKAAFPATRKFLAFIETKAKTFENFLDTKAASGELTAFFTRATKLAGDFGQIFGNISSFIGDVIESNFGPNSGGQYMINVFKQSTLRLRNLREEMGATKMDDYFYQASINARLVLGLIGDMAKGLAALGAMSEVQETFTKLREVGPYLQKWLAEGAKLGPIMADVVLQITKFMSVFSESGNVLTFFSTIRNVFKVMADLMQNELIAGIVGFVTKISAFALAVRTLGTLFAFIFGKVIFGSIMAIVSQFKAMGTAMAAARTGAITLGAALKTMGPPILIVISTIVLALMEIGAEAQRNREAVLGTLDDVNAAARSTAYDGMGVLKKSFGEISGSIEYTRTMAKDGVWNSFAESFDTSKITTDIKTFKTALAVATEATVKAGDAVNTYSKNSGQIIGIGENTIETVQKAFSTLGSGLADVARTDLTLMSAKFKDIATTMDLSESEIKLLIKNTPELKTALTEAAGAANLLVNDQTLANIAMGRGADAADAVATQLYGVDGAAKAAAERVDLLNDKIFGFGAVTLDVRAANRAFEAAVDDLSTAISTNGKTLDVSTEAGRNNSAALDTLVKSGTDYINSVFEQNNNTEEANKSLADLRDRVAEAAQKMGLGKTAAEKLAASLVGSKFDVQMVVKPLTPEEANAAVSKIKSQLSAAAKAGFSIALTPADIAAIQSGKIKVNKRYGGYINAFSAGVPRFAPGGPVFGPGTGTSDSIPAMLSNGEFVVNANATAKNRSLLEQINSGNQSAAGGSNVSIVVNPGPDMDVKELAAEVSRRLAFTMRKGASA